MDGYMSAIFKHDPKAVPPASATAGAWGLDGEESVKFEVQSSK
jgi:hypothetical protein